MDAGKASQRRVLCVVLKMRFLLPEIYEISAGGSRAKTAAQGKEVTNDLSRLFLRP